MSELSTVALNGSVDGVTALADGGWLDLYEGVKPSPDVDTDALRLCTLRLGRPAFRAALGGRAEAYPIQPCPAADATGHVTWYRVWRDDHSTPVFQGTAGPEGEDRYDMTLKNDLILAGAEVVVRSLVYQGTRVQP